MAAPEDHQSVMVQLAKWTLLVAVLSAIIAFVAWYWPRPSDSLSDRTGTPVSPEQSDSLSDRTRTPVPPEQVEKMEYISAADTVCLRSAAVAGQMPRGEVTLDQQEGSLRVLESMLVQWGALTPPAQGRAIVDGIISTYQQGTDASRQAFIALNNGDQATYERLRQESIALGNDAQTRSREYGFRVR